MTADVTSDALALRPRQAAKLLNVSLRTLHRWTQAGLIPHTKIGVGRRKTVLYPRDELIKWLAAQTSGMEGPD